MDINAIEQELNKKFDAPLPEFFKRRIVIWFDEEKEFEEQIDELVLQNAMLIKLTGTNNFQIKKLISMDEPHRNLLIYNPLTIEKLEDNWLLDVEMYSEEFRADLTAIWMDEMGIPSSVALRNQVKKYSKFLKAKTRRDDVVKLSDSLDTAMKLQLAIIVVVDSLRISADILFERNAPEVLSVLVLQAY